MKIERGHANSWRISSIPIGEAFVLENGVLHIKTDEFNDGKRACVRLDNGRVVWFDDETFVYKTIVKVVVE